MAEGPKIWGAQHYKLFIYLSRYLYFWGGEALETRPLPPPSFAGSYGYQRERGFKKVSTYSPRPSIIHYVSHVCGTLDLQIIVDLI